MRGILDYNSEGYFTSTTTTTRTSTSTRTFDLGQVPKGAGPYRHWLHYRAEVLAFAAAKRRYVQLLKEKARLALVEATDNNNVGIDDWDQVYISDESDDAHEVWLSDSSEDSLNFKRRKDQSSPHQQHLQIYWNSRNALDLSDSDEDLAMASSPLKTPNARDRQMGMGGEKQQQLSREIIIDPWDNNNNDNNRHANDNMDNFGNNGNNQDNQDRFQPLYQPQPPLPQMPALPVLNQPQPPQKDSTMNDHEDNDMGKNENIAPNSQSFSTPRPSNGKQRAVFDEIDPTSTPSSSQHNGDSNIDFYETNSNLERLLQKYNAVPGESSASLAPPAPMSSDNANAIIPMHGLYKFLPTDDSISGWRVRRDPSNDGEVIGTLSLGCEILVTQRKGDWLKVTPIDTAEDWVSGWGFLPRNNRDTFLQRVVEGEGDEGQHREGVIPEMPFENDANAHFLPSAYINNMVAEEAAREFPGANLPSGLEESLFNKNVTADMTLDDEEKIRIQRIIKRAVHLARTRESQEPFDPNRTLNSTRRAPGTRSGLNTTQRLQREQLKKDSLMKSALIATRIAADTIKERTGLALNWFKRVKNVVLREMRTLRRRRGKEEGGTLVVTLNKRIGQNLNSIGLQLETNNGNTYISKLIPGSRAYAEASLREGQFIVGVNTKSTVGCDKDEVANFVNSLPPGTFHIMLTDMEMVQDLVSPTQQQQMANSSYAPEAIGIPPQEQRQPAMSVATPMRNKTRNSDALLAESPAPRREPQAHPQPSFADDNATQDLEATTPGPMGPTTPMRDNTMISQSLYATPRPETKVQQNLFATPQHSSSQELSKSGSFQQHLERTPTDRSKMDQRNSAVRRLIPDDSFRL
eukprot:m.90484 g.90484  ORF g.90484 m.90484 type:complete len:861 (+) comp13269_c2_seq1:57-2639(+)